MTPQILREYLVVITEFGWKIGVGVIILACASAVLRGEK